jgi:UDP-N-acetylmuramoyl-tripeptide--D-alanyl-D-alanine ligase
VSTSTIPPRLKLIENLNTENSLKIENYNVMNFLSKIKFIFKKTKVILVAGQGRACAREAICRVLEGKFELGKDVLVFETDLTKEDNAEKFKFLLKNSPFPVLVATHAGDIPFAQDFFAGEKERVEEIMKLAEILPSQGHLILNFDDETVREIIDETNLKELTFGFGEGADLRASDVNLNSGTNFKINERGNVVPIWLEGLFGKEQIYSALAAAAAGTIFGLNLVEISQALKNYQSLEGKMQLIEGLKNSKILDDSRSATVFSMLEALDIFGKIQNPEQGRRIAVLGDVSGIGKYAIEVHESIGEKTAKSADLLFTFGPRAKLIGKGAIVKGMPLEKIFQFDTIDEGMLKLKDELREGDLVLVDGSKEMEMGKIVEAIKL